MAVSPQLAEFAGLLQHVVDDLGWMVEHGEDRSELDPLMAEFTGNTAAVLGWPRVEVVV